MRQKQESKGQHARWTKHATTLVYTRYYVLYHGYAVQMENCCCVRTSIPQSAVELTYEKLTISSIKWLTLIKVCKQDTKRANATRLIGSV